VSFRMARLAPDLSDQGRARWYYRLMRLFRATGLLAAGLLHLNAQNPVLHSIQIMGGTGLDTIKSITPDGAGNLYVLGIARSVDFPATIAFGPTPTASTNTGNTFVAKIHLEDWSLTWCVIIRPSNPLALAVDASGNTYVTASSDSPDDFPTTPGAFRSSAVGNSSALFVLKLNPQGTGIAYSSLLGFVARFAAAPIAVDSQGQAYIASNGVVQTTPGAFITSSGGDLFLSKLTSDGSGQIFSTYLTTGGRPTGAAIALDGQQNVIVAGAEDGNFPGIQATAGAIQSVNAGGYDAFIMKIQSDGGGLVFATLLGGRGGDFASYLQVAADGSIYVAGQCDSGSDSSQDAPFPTTDSAPYRQFVDINGFVAHIDTTGTTLLFSTYISDVSNSGAEGLSLVSDVTYAPFNYTLTRDFLGLELMTAA
jgi:hypothetical protein